MLVTRKEFVEYCVYESNKREEVAKAIDDIKKDISDIKYAIGLRIKNPSYNWWPTSLPIPYAESEEICDLEEKLALIEKHLGIKYQQEAVKPATYVKTKEKENVNRRGGKKQVLGKEGVGQRGTSSNRRRRVA